MTYQVIELPFLSGGTSSAAVSCSTDKSTIVGWATDGADVQHAVFWTGDTITELPTLEGATLSGAAGCSSTGSTIVGAITDSQSNIHAVKWIDGALNDITKNTNYTGVWDPSHLFGVATLSESNTVVNIPSGASFASGSVRSTPAIAGSGLVFFTLDVIFTGNEFWSFGICNGDFDVSAGGIIGRDTDGNSIGGWYFDEAPGLYLKGVNLGTTFTVGTGPVTFAINFDTQLAWYGDGSTWNDGGDANPLSGVGGYSIAGFGTGPYYATFQGTEINAINIGIVPSGIVTQCTATKCSGDGSIIIGYVGLPSYTTGLQAVAVYWDSDGVHVLPSLATRGENQSSQAVDISADGTVIAGTAINDVPDSRGVVWTDGPDWVITSLGTIDVPLDDTSSAFGISFDGSTVAGYGVDTDSLTHAVYWTDLESPVITELEYINGTFAKATAANIDGTIIVGVALNGSVQTATIWTSGTGAFLPLRAGDVVNLATRIADVTLIVGIGENGSAISHALKWIPAGTPSEFALGPLAVTEMFQIDDNRQVTLTWSDDAGASWANPVNQTLGGIGEYETNIQWRRLGYSRNRVIRISWSGSMPTALLGAFVQVEIAKT